MGRFLYFSQAIHFAKLLSVIQDLQAQIPGMVYLFIIPYLLQERVIIPYLLTLMKQGLFISNLKIIVDHY